MNNQFILDLSKIESLMNKYLNDTKELNDNDFNKKLNGKEWSVAQAIYHTWAAIDLTYQFVDKQLLKTQQRNKISARNTIRYILLKLALISPLKFKAPPQIKDKLVEHITHKELEQNNKETFENFKSLLQTFPENLKEQEIFFHPVIGWINISQTIGFLIEHTAHHKAQIYRLKSSLSKS